MPDITAALVELWSDVNPVAGYTSGHLPELTATAPADAASLEQLRERIETLRAQLGSLGDDDLQATADAVLTRSHPARTRRGRAAPARPAQGWAVCMPRPRDLLHPAQERLRSGVGRAIPRGGHGNHRVRDAAVVGPGLHGPGPARVPRHGCLRQGDRPAMQGQRPDLQPQCQAILDALARYVALFALPGLDSDDFATFWPVFQHWDAAPRADRRARLPGVPTWLLPAAAERGRDRHDGAGVARPRAAGRRVDLGARPAAAVHRGPADAAGDLGPRCRGTTASLRPGVHGEGRRGHRRLRRALRDRPHVRRPRRVRPDAGLPRQPRHRRGGLRRRLPRPGARLLAALPHRGKELVAADDDQHPRPRGVPRLQLRPVRQGRALAAAQPEHGAGGPDDGGAWRSGASTSTARRRSPCLRSSRRTRCSRPTSRCTAPRPPIRWPPWLVRSSRRTSGGSSDTCARCATFGSTGATRPTPTSSRGPSSVTGLSEEFLHGECFTFMASPGYAPCYAVGAVAYASAQARAGARGVSSRLQHGARPAMGSTPGR